MKVNKTYIIRNKTTKEIWHANSGKSSWKRVGDAKNAWHCSSYHSSYFDDQCQWEIVELKHESEAKLEYYEELVDWLVDMIPNLDDMIEQFNESYGVSDES